MCHILQYLPADTHTIRTERLTLVLLTPDTIRYIFSEQNEHAAEIFGHRNADETESDRKKSEGGYETYRTTMRHFMLYENEQQRVIGRGGFHNYYPSLERAELGYMMTDEALKNKGYMKEAVAAMIRHGFEDLGLHRMEAYVGKDNEPSNRLMQHFGFTHEGLLREHYLHGGIYHDSIVYGLLKGEWEKL